MVMATRRSAARQGAAARTARTVAAPKMLKHDLMKMLFAVFTFVLCANAQSSMRNNVAFHVGQARDVGEHWGPANTALSLGATYGYRPIPNLQIEAGVITAIHPSPEIRGAHYDVVPNDLFTWVPFGLRGILPLRGGRFELSAAAGGLYERYSVGNLNTATGPLPRTGWGGYFGLGAAVAIDRGRHLWLGTSPRLFMANSEARDRWVAIGGEVGFRF